MYRHKSFILCRPKNRPTILFLIAHNKTLFSTFFLYVSITPSCLRVFICHWTWTIHFTFMLCLQVSEFLTFSTLSTSTILISNVAYRLFYLECRSWVYFSSEEILILWNKFTNPLILPDEYFFYKALAAGIIYVFPFLLNSPYGQRMCREC